MIGAKMSEVQSLEQVLQRVGDLPTMPEVAAEAVDLMSRPDSDMGEVAEIIGRDPALTAKLLKVANSPYYGMRQVVGSLKLALVILGAREIRNILIGVTMIDTFDTAATAPITRGNFWEHSFRVGALSKRISEHFSLRFQGEDFIAGLLHDIGKLVLYRQLPREYAPVFQQASAAHAEIESIENTTFGFDHSDAGGAVANVWNLPETLRDAVMYHHVRDGRTLDNAKDPKLAAVVRIANLAAEEDVTGPEFQPETSECCTDAEAWSVLENDTGGTPESRYAVLVEFVREVNESPPLKF